MKEKNKSTTNSNSTPSGFFASSLQNAVKCYKQFLSDAGFQFFCLDDLIAQENSLQELLSDIKVPKSTVYLILDQILVSFGNRVVLVKKKNTLTKGSTFQGIIKARHDNVVNMN